jgi:hypothetical protein
VAAGSRICGGPWFIGRPPTLAPFPPATGGAVGELPLTDRLDDAFIPIEQAQGDPPRIRQTWKGGFDFLRHALDGRLQFGRRRLQAPRSAYRPPAGHFVQGLQQKVESFPRAGDRRHDRHAQVARQAPLVDLQPVAAGLVHQVQADHDTIRDLQHLQDQVEIALQPGNVADDQRDIRLPEEQKVARHFLIGARRQQGIRPGQIDQFEAAAAVLETALRASYRLARPVAGVLAQAGEGVEDRALAGVGIATEGDHIVPLGHVDAQAPQVGGVMRRTGDAVVGALCGDGVLHDCASGGRAMRTRRPARGRAIRHRGCGRPSGRRGPS